MGFYRYKYDSENDFVFGTDAEDKDAYRMFDENKEYVAKALINYRENKVYKAVKNHLDDLYEVFPQVNLQSFIDTPNNKKRNDELFRNLDLVVFSKHSFRPIVAIEINDERHYYNNYTIRRDESVANILERVHVPLSTINNDEVDEEVELQEKNIVKMLKSKSKLLDELLH